MNDDDIVFSYTLGDKLPDFKKSKKNSKIEKKYNAPRDGFIRIQLEKNKRGGKTVCVIYGFSSDVDLDLICRQLKKQAGCGGTVKNNVIEIQGDKRANIEKYLNNQGYKTKRVGG